MKESTKVYLLKVVGFILFGLILLMAMGILLVVGYTIVYGSPITHMEKELCAMENLTYDGRGFCYEIDNKSIVHKYEITHIDNKIYLSVSR